ncbi:hypothetical protein [Tamlana flava]|uniref:hypothetical protein n=1 Tax=Tamlana flava TaxID=3158572 RepID=UPI00351ACDED
MNWQKQLLNRGREDCAISTGISNFINVVIRLLLTISLGLVAASCFSSKEVKASFTLNPESLRYLYDSNPIDCNRDKVVYFELFDSIPLNNYTPFNKKGWGAIPLVAFNLFWQNYEVVMGQDMAFPNYHQFFSESIITESQRTGCFTLKEKQSEHDTYILKLMIDKCETKSKLTSTFGFMVGGYTASSGDGHTGKPSNTELIVNAELLQNGVTIFEKEYNLIHHQPFLSKTYQAPNARNTDIDLKHNMVESLSFATKNIIENIILDINNTLTSL